MFRAVTLVMLAVASWSLAAADKEELASLTKSLKSKTKTERLKAVEATGKLGKDGKELSPVLVESMVFYWPADKEKYLDALERIDPDIYKPVLSVLVDKDNSTKIRAMRDLAELKKAAIGALPILHSIVRALQADKTDQSSEQYRSLLVLGAYSVDTMVNIAPDEKTVHQAIYGLLKSQHGYARNHAFRALPKLSTYDSKQMADTLIPLLESKDSGYKLTIIEMLGDTGPAAKKALPALKALKIDGKADEREAAGKAIKRIEDK